MKKVCLLVVICNVYYGVFSQSHQLGVSAGLYNYYYYGDAIVGNWLLEAHNPAVPGTVFGLNYRQNFQHIYFESQISYGYNPSKIALSNLTVDRDYEGHYVGNTITSNSQNELSIEFALGAQFKYKRVNFRGFFGLKPSFLIKMDTTGYFHQPWDEIKRCIYRSTETAVLYGSWGFGIDYWRLSFDIKRENNLTPIISSINYEGATYDYNLDTKRLYFILGFNFYPWKPRKAEAASGFD